MRKSVAALLTVLLAATLFAAASAEPFDRSVYEVALNDMYYSAENDWAPEWMLIGDTGFHLTTNDPEQYSDLTMFLVYNAAPEGCSQADVNPRLLIRIQEYNHGQKNLLEPATLWIQVNGVSYAFAGFTPTVFSTPMLKIEDEYWEVPLGESFRQMADNLSAAETVDIQLIFKREVFSELMPMQKVPVNEYLGRWVDFEYFMNVSHVWENLSREALDRAFPLGRAENAM